MTVPETAPDLEIRIWEKEKHRLLIELHFRRTGAIRFSGAVLKAFRQMPVYRGIRVNRSSKSGGSLPVAVGLRHHKINLDIERLAPFSLLARNHLIPVENNRKRIWYIEKWSVFILYGA